MATLDTSFWRPFELYNGSLGNAYICFLIIYGLHNVEMVISNPMHFDQYEYHCANYMYFWPHKRWIPNFPCMCQSIPSRLTFRYSEVQYSKNVRVEESNARLEIWRANIEMLTIAKLIKINVLFRVQRKLFLQFAIQASWSYTFTSPNIISTSPKNVLMSRLISQLFCNLNSSKKLHLPIGQVNNRIH